MSSKIKILMMMSFVLFISGCVDGKNKIKMPNLPDSIKMPNLPDSMDIFGPDKEGWSSSQKRAFVKILKTDKYMSICNKKILANKVISRKNSRLMTQMFTAYANNLANGCINRASFGASQRARKSKKIDTHYSMPTQKIQSEELRSKLRLKLSIEKILEPYVPKGTQFRALSKKYKRYVREGNTSAVLLKKIRLNIERAKLLPKNLGSNHVLMNIPEYKVRLFESGKKSIEFRTVVGKKNMQTPVFSSKLKYVTVNPQWNVPDSIARKSYIPKIRRNSRWLSAMGMELHKSYDIKSPRVNPASVNWSKYPVNGKGHIPYKIIQKPSKRNSLGRVKFMFPNRFAVYMHDTQAKNLFKRKTRAHSHGCIRLQKPKVLLDYITTNYTSKSVKKVHKYYNSRKSHTISLNKSLPVHTSYFTTYIDTDGKLRTFNDVYGYDKIQKLTFNM